MSKRKIIVIVVLVLFVGISLWLILKKPKQITIQEGAPLPIIKFPLKQGSSGYGVEQVQKYLNKKYAAGIKVDGDWGPLTNSAALLHLKRDNVSESAYKNWDLNKY